MRIDRLRGALVGFGNMAEKGHLPGWQKDRKISLLAVCDPSKQRRSRAEELLPQARIYPTLEDLLANESLDFLDVCTPPPFHAASILSGLNHDLHVLCEKPFVGTRSEFRRILQLCRKKKRIAFPVHNWKHAPVLALLQKRIREGRLGRVLHSEFHTLRAQPAVGLTPWRGEKENAGGGGILLDHGWHVAYLLMSLHQETPQAVSTWMNPSPALTGEAEQTAHLLLEFPGSTASMFLTWRAGLRFNSARVYGDAGFAVIEDDRLTIGSRDGSRRTTVFRDPLSRGSHHPNWFPPVADRFLHAIGHPEEAEKELEEARLCLEIIRKGYDSNRRGGKRLLLSS
jgi:predicted dehydrogenase